MNRNLHSPTKLTEFAREFDEPPETVFSKIVTKLTNAYNTSYNSVNVLPQQITHPANVGSPTLVSPVNCTQSTSVEPKIDNQIAFEKASTSSTSPSDSSSATDIAEGFSRDDSSSLDNASGRIPGNVRHLLNNIVALKNNNLTSYKNSEHQRFWMPDATSKECYDCSQKFTTFRRKHHCRLCGQIFCAKCCNQVVPGKIIKCSGDLKVCTYCSKLILSYLKSSDIHLDLKTDLKALQEVLSNKFAANVETSASVEGSHTNSPLRRKISAGYQEEKLISYPNSSLSENERKTILQQSNSLKCLHEDMTRLMPNQNKGIELINFMITNQKSSNQVQAIAILNALVEAGFLLPLPNSSSVTIENEFDENTLYKLMKKENALSNSGSFQLDMNYEASSVLLSRGGNEIRAIDVNKTDASLGCIALSDLELQNSLNSTAGSSPLLEAFCEHEELLLNQLLRNENLSPSWAKILIRLCAGVVNTFKSEIFSVDSMDIRSIVNFKKIPGGSRKESGIVRGIAFSKNIAHKDMATKIEKPRILLLQCAIVYQRDEGKFVSFETLLLQEREYLRNVVERIVNLKPNVILVHKNVAGIAQDMLRKRNITLVLDVKLSVLERLARSLKCDIVTSIDSNIGRPKLATCDLFYLKSYNDDMGVYKNLMFFETTLNPRCCSILLRGGTFSELTRVKRVVSFALLARYNWRLEMSFLLDEFARPPSPKASIFESKELSPCEPVNFDVDNDMSISERLATESKSSPTNLTEDESDTEIEPIEKDSEVTPKRAQTAVPSDNDNRKSVQEKTVIIEPVPDFSDPLRAIDLSPSAFDPESSIEFAVQIPYDNKFRNALSSTVLSVSPFISFPLPYLETESGRNCALRTMFPNELYYSKQWSTNAERNVPIEPIIDKNLTQELYPVHEFVNYKIKSLNDQKEVQSLLANFRACGGRFPKVIRMKPITKKTELPVVKKPVEEMVYKDALDLENHQRLPVLFCSYYYSPKAPSSFCAQPSLLNMQFYGQNDIMLGSFLERYCFRSSYICQSCNLPMLDHVRRYVHSLGCIQVKIGEEMKKGDQDQILMSSWCSICNEATPNTPMSRETWCLSFAKYLEIRFHGHSYKRRVIDVAESSCDHSLHKDYVQYFSYNGIVASFMYSPVVTWEICLPSLSIELQKPKVFDQFQVLEEIKTFALKGYDVFVKIHDRLAHLSSDAEFPMLGSLKKILNQDQLTFRQRVETVQTLLVDKPVGFELEDAMLLVRRALAESIEQWGPRLNEAAIQSRNMTTKSDSTTPIDLSSICTEDLRAESPSAGSDNPKEDSSKATNSETSDNETEPIDNKCDEETVSIAKPPTPEFVQEKKQDLFDKKNIKQLISHLLPSTGNIHSLQSPLPPNEHHTLPLGAFPMLVNDQDLSSIIAFCLISQSNHSPNLKRKSFEGSIDSDEKDSKSDHEKQKIKPSSHCNMQFHDSTTQFTCKIYFAHEFDHMRMKFLKSPVFDKKSKNLSPDSSDDRKTEKLPLPKSPNELSSIALCEEVRRSFARSLSRSIRWEARGGKSGSEFSKTTDDRFILKEMSKQDVSLFENFAPNYFEYVNHSLQHNQPTLLAKIFGVFRVTIKKKDFVLDKSVLIMENLFFGRDISNKFDLKGSERNRLVDPTNQNSESVLLDENLIQMSWSKPLYILTHSKTILREAIHRDASFLERNNVMDYSLLVGLASKEQQLVLGIIDYIRKFTIDKRIESLVKQTGFLGGQGKLPTVICPKQYKPRFTEAMERYFLSVPDRWEGLSIK